MTDFDIRLDTQIRDWVLIPIMLVMVLIGVLRHYITLLLATPPKTSLKSIREAQALNRARILKSSANAIPFFAFESRRKLLCKFIDEKKYVAAAKQAEGQDPVNPMSDPAQMDVMMDGMKKNMAMMVPQMVMMGWVNYFFAGFVLSTRHKCHVNRSQTPVPIDTAVQRHVAARYRNFRYGCYMGQLPVMVLSKSIWTQGHILLDPR